MSNKKQVLMICTGNICRSPMAEGIYHHLCRQYDIYHSIDSAGTHGYHIGEKADQRAINVMNNHQIDIRHLRARKLHPNDLHTFDLILVATDAHLRTVSQLARQVSCTVTIEKMLKTHPEKPDHDLSDPYYGTLSDFEITYNELFEALNARLNNERIC